MAVIPALMSGVPFTNSQVYAGTGAVTGTVVCAIPPAATRMGERFVTVQITTSADPGASVFNLMGSLDGTNFFLLSAINAGSPTSAPFGATIRANVSQIRLDQASKTNAVNATSIFLME